MKIELTPEQTQRKDQFDHFAENHIMPVSAEHDRKQRISKKTICKIAEQGFLGSMIPEAHGGMGLDRVCLGLLNEAFGRACTNTRNLLTVHGMAALAIVRMGTSRQKEQWLQKLAAGEAIGAFALSEPQAGSDAKGLRTEAVRCDDGYILNGEKKWITMGQIADVFLVFAHCEGGLTAFLVEKETPGLTRTPIKDMMGHRGSMLAKLHFQDCRIPLENVIGRVGVGLTMVALHCLDYGRYTIAWGCVGLAQACLEESVRYARDRCQFGRPIIENQLIQQMVTQMAVGVDAARLLCCHAGCLHDINSPDSIMATWKAKYFSTKNAVTAAGHAVQIHGGNGFVNGKHKVERYYRDAKIHEVIEGSTQVHEMLIARHTQNIV